MIAGLPIDRGPLAGWVTLDALAADRFDLAEAYFVAAERGDPGLDRRGQGAYFIGAIAYYLAATVAVSQLHHNTTPDITWHNFAVTTAGGGAMDLRYRLAEDTGITPRPIGEVLDTAMVPLIGRVKLATRLAEPAQWRLVADGLAAAFLLAGHALGCPDRAQAAAMAAVRDPRFKPFNGHTGFHRLSETEVFLKRGGCCRYYTCDAGSYCATCILRSPQDQLLQLQRQIDAVRP
jgi:hypothetical protein